LLADSGDLDEAQAAYEKALAIERNLALAHAGLGQIAAKRKDFLAAAQHFEQALSIAPGAQAHYQLAQAYRMIGRAEEANEQLALFRRTEQELPLQDPLVFSVHGLRIGGQKEFEVGTRLADEGEWEEAIPHFEEAMRLHPELADEAHFRLGAIKWLQGEADAAIEHYRLALESQPDDHRTLNNLGVALLRQERLDEAMECFRRAVACNPSDAMARANLGEAFERLGRHDAAIEQYSLAVQYDPSLAGVHRSLARTLEVKGDFEASARHWREYLHSAPEDVSALVSLAAALARCGRGAEAEQVFDQASWLAPDDANLAAQRTEILGQHAERE
ncbi:MAG: tetratricopeptide repeat protein, partial [Phycisphaerales bacterium]